MTAEDPAAVDWAQASEAARRRATECGRRVDALLESGAASTQADVARAQEHTLRALGRARLARKRWLRMLQLRHQREALRRLETTRLRKTSVLPPRTDQPEGLLEPDADLRQALDSGAVSTQGLWIEFLTYGGDAPFMEFDAYLHGAWSMALQDRRVLEHVWWEHEHLA